MNILIFDASTSTMMISIVKNNKIKDMHLRKGDNDHSRYMTDSIAKMLEKNNLEISKIDQIIVGIGPGSYTGIRVAVMTAKMLSYVNNIKLYKISSLKLLTSGYNDLVIPLIDARRGQVFTTIFHKDKILLEDTLILKDKLTTNENYNINNEILISHNSIKLNLDIINYYKKEVVDVNNLEPNYLRKTEAEINYDQKS